MPEPSTTAAAATLATAPPAVAALTAFGVSLGLQAGVLVAGFAGALVAIVLLGSVPAEGDTWQHMLGTTVKRLFVALASALTAGYLTPIVMALTPLSEAVEFGLAFAVGAGAQRVLRAAIDRVATTAAPGGQGGNNTGEGKP
jgi:hypothetical protein